MLRFALGLGLASIFAALPSAASALPSGQVSPLACLADNDLSPAPGCARSGDGLSGVDDFAISPDGRNVYVAGGGDDALTRLNVAPDGTLTFGGCIEDNDPPEGPDNCAESTDGLDITRDVLVSPDGRNVYAIGRADDAIVRFDRAADGTLTPAGCIDDDETGPENCAAVANGMENPTALAISPNGRTVYVATSLDNAVMPFSRDPITGALTPTICAEDNDNGPDACGPSLPGLENADDIAVAPDGKNAYVTSNDTGDSAIVRLDLASNGTIVSGSCIDDVDAAESPETCAGTAEGLADIERVAVSHDGQSVYTVAGADGAIAQFDRGASGALTPVECIGGDDCPDIVPSMTGVQGVTVSPDDDLVHVAVAGQSAVRTFRRATDGSLAPSGCVRVAVAAGCSVSNMLATPRALVTDPSGRRLYLLDAVTGAVTLAAEEPPVCVGRASSGAPDTAQTVPLDCSDLNGDPVTIEIVEGPANGALGAVDQTAGTVLYTPNAGFAGVDSFVFRAVADGAASQPVTATVAVGAATGPAGPAGPGGSTGTPGPPGPAGTPAIALLALLGQDTFGATSGKRATFRIAATAPGSARLRILKGRKVLVTLSKSLAKAGRTSIAWNGKAGSGRRAKALAAGRYTLSLEVEGRDGQKAADSARLTVARAKKRR